MTSDCKPETRTEVKEKFLELLPNAPYALYDSNPDEGCIAQRVYKDTNNSAVPAILADAPNKGSISPYELMRIVNANDQLIDALRSENVVAAVIAEHYTSLSDAINAL